MNVKIGIKREYEEMNKEFADAESSMNRTHTAPFASLLPPLNKKPKLIKTTHIIPPTWDETPPQLSHATPILKPIIHNIAHPMVNNINNCYFMPVPCQPIATNTNNTPSLDSIITTLSGLNSINTAQLDALKNLILITGNNNHFNMHHRVSGQHAKSTTTPRTATLASSPSIQHIDNPLSNVTLCAKDLKCRSFASCHQCKTKKDVSILFYCTKTRPCANDSFKRKRCRKKYCGSCMAKYYAYNDLNQLRCMKDAERWCWDCPSCIEICTCRACKRKKENNTPQVMDISGPNDLQNIAHPHIPQYVVDERISRGHNMDIGSRMTQGSVGNNGNMNNSNGLVQQILSNPQLRILFQ